VTKHDETLISEGVSYDLDERVGHIIGTVIRCNMQKSQKGTSYHVIWEYTALGESTLTLSEVLEGYKEGEKVMSSRNSTSTTALVKRVRCQHVIAKDDLCYMSEDGLEMHAPSSDESCSSGIEHSDTECNTAWGILERHSELHPELATFFVAPDENCANDTLMDYIRSITVPLIPHPIRK
jgi:hypothetical protein